MFMSVGVTFVTEFSHYLFSALREGDLTLHRGSGDGLSPILVVAADDASTGSLKRLQHEYALKAELDLLGRPGQSRCPAITTA